MEYLIGLLFILAVGLVVYKNRHRSWLDRAIVAVVVIIASVVVWLSFHNTARLAEELKMNPYGTAFLVEIIFAALLGIRARQRATQRNVPRFIHIGFGVSFLFVTGVNMYGLAQENSIVGAIVGLAISGAMWLMENTLVWFWTESHLPHKKTARELMKEAKKEIKEMKLLQKIQWMKWEAMKPDLDLIKEARKTEEKREKVVSEGLPEYFRNKLGGQVAHIKEITQKLFTQNKTITQTQVAQDEVTQQDKTAQENVAQNEVIAHNKVAQQVTQERSTQDQEITQTPKQMNFTQNESPAQKGDYFTQEKAIVQTPKMSDTVDNSYKVDKPEKETKVETAQENIAQQITQENAAQNEKVAQERITQEVITQQVTQENIAQNHIAQEDTTQDRIAQKDVAQNKVTQKKVTRKQIAQGKVIFLKDKIAQTKIEDKLKKFRKKDEIAHAIDCALDHEQKNGSLPTKRELMELANCTDHQAKEALRIIREVSEEMEQTG